ncbi:MAG: ABC transporter ATP-binding protein [Desulfurivibrionaceae bacterium]
MRTFVREPDRSPQDVVPCDRFPVMAAPVLSLQGIGKSYRDYASFARRFCGWFGLSAGSFQENWVLRGITFDVSPGEAVGIAGRNGAGKSTLLKMITGTLAATEGSFVVRGRISAILELGMGFHPEFTGRQNAMHACGLMGYEPARILALMPQIEDFAEIGEYFEQPVRTYSSGMQMRLAFSVATASRPEILIVDEALSVGDAYFQHKSFAQIRKFQAQGTTLLIVSHDRGAILSLCDRVVLLEKGHLLMDGPPPAVMDYYNALIAEQECSTIMQNQGLDACVRTTSGTGEAVFEEILFLDEQGNPVETIEAGSVVTLRLRVRVINAIPELNIGCMIQDRLGRTIFGTNTHYLKRTLHDVSAGQQLVYAFTFAADLGPGSYALTVAAHAGSAHLQRNYEWRDLALIFEVVNTTHPEFIGCNWLQATLSIEQDNG